MSRSVSSHSSLTTAQSSAGPPASHSHAQTPSLTTIFLYHSRTHRRDEVVDVSQSTTPAIVRTLCFVDFTFTSSPGSHSVLCSTPSNETSQQLSLLLPPQLVIIRLLLVVPPSTWDDDCPLPWLQQSTPPVVLAAVPSDLLHPLPREHSNPIPFRRATCSTMVPLTLRAHIR